MNAKDCGLTDYYRAVMKVLRVKGINLASLREFDIDFREVTRNRKKIFAIIGDTGAGKSTILDAICFGIYGKTPRIAKFNSRSGKLDLEDFALSPDDPINIMTRGQNNCSATVYFEGVGGQQYRSSFSISKKRIKYSYNYQLEKLDESGDAIKITSSENKTAVHDDIIRKYTGLTWDQFRRVIVLPQGDFAAFLEDDPDAKSKLLEKLTGTEIYKKIDDLVSSKYKILENGLKDYERQIEIISEKLLTDDVKEEKKRELYVCRENIDSVDRKIQLINDFSECRIELKKADEEITEKNAECQSLEKQREDYKDDYRVMELYHLSEPVKDVHVQLTNQEDRLSSLKRELNAFSEKIVFAETQLKTDTETLEISKQKTIACKNEIIQKEPKLVEAEKLEKEKSNWLTLINNHNTSKSDKEKKLKDAEDELAKAEKDETEIKLDLDILQKKNEQNRKYSYIKTIWHEFSTNISMYREKVKLLADKKSLIAEKKCEQQEHLRKWQESYLKYTVLTGDSNTYSFEEGRLPEFGMYVSASGIAKRFIEEYTTINTGLTMLGSKIDDYIAEAENFANCLSGIVANSQRRLQFDDVEGSRFDTLKKRECELKEIIMAVSTGIKMHDYVVNLKPGEPCPCCGSTVHPRIDNLQNGLDGLLDKLKADKDKYEGEQKRVDADIKVYQENRQKLDSERESLFNGLGNSHKKLQNTAREISLSIQTADAVFADSSLFSCMNDDYSASCLVNMRDLLTGIKRDGETLLQNISDVVKGFTSEITGAVSATEQNAEACCNAMEQRIFNIGRQMNLLKKESDNVTAFRNSMKEKYREIGAIDAGLTETGRVVEGIRNTYERYKSSVDFQSKENAVLQTVENEITALKYQTDDERLANVWEKMVSVPDDKFNEFIRDYNRIVKDLNDFEKNKEKMEALLKAQEVEIKNCEKNRNNVQTELGKIFEKIAECENNMAEIDARLNTLTSGIPVRTLRSTLQKNIEEALREEQKAELAKNTSCNHLNNCLEREKEYERDIKTTGSTVECLKKKLMDGVDDIVASNDNIRHFSIEEILDGLKISSETYKKSEDRIQILEEKISKVKDGIDKKQAVRDDVEGRLFRIKEQMSPDDLTGDGDSVRENVLSEAIKYKNELEEQKLSLETDLRNDEKSIVDIDNLNKKCDEIRDGNRALSGLRELFDSKKSFKLYAQSITFGYLVNKSNRYVLDFSDGRYELKCVTSVQKNKGAEQSFFEIVVIDHDQGDLCRPVSSLSGGERFRISLGMALGLSDLIVRSVRVDTMFIDEGFDTLDNERLDSLLNSLTKVTNRQIGIITHVDQVVNGGMIESKILVRSCEGNSTRSEVVVLK